MTSAAAPLPADEAASIIDELGDSVPAGIGRVRPYTFGQEKVRAPEQLTGLERLGEKVARALRGAIEPFTQARTQVSAQPLAILPYADWVAGLPFFMSLSHYRLQPLRGGMLIAIEPGFVAALIERFYGGSAGGPSPRRSEFTAGEELLLGRLLDKLLAILVEQWSEVTPITATLAQRETSSTHIGFVRAEEPVVVQSFTVKPADGEAATLAVVYPLAMLKPIEERMAVRIHDDEPAGSSDWRERLAAALGAVPLPVRSVLARPEITLAELMELKVGDVIPIQLNPRTPLLIAQRAIAEGTIGEQDGRAALLIEKVGAN